MIHRENIESYPGTLTDLAVEIGNLRYDALAEFLRTLAGKLAADAAADSERRRPQLAAALRDGETGVAAAAAAVDLAWQISAPHM